MHGKFALFLVSFIAIWFACVHFMNHSVIQANTLDCLRTYPVKVSNFNKNFPLCVAGQCNFTFLRRNVSCSQTFRTGTFTLGFKVYRLNSGFDLWNILCINFQLNQCYIKHAKKSYSTINVCSYTHTILLYFDCDNHICKGQTLYLTIET